MRDRKQALDYKGRKPDTVVKSPVGCGVKCPHCGGTEGYLYKAHLYGTQWMTWEGDGVNFQDNGSRAFKKKCVDCGKGI
jgi:hypothetical protein